MPLPSSSFALATCQVGAERALKAEVQRQAPTLRPAFMRPGFVTFKSTAPVAATFALDLVFARVFASSLGKVSSDDVVARAFELAAAHGPLRLHVWERERFAPGDPAADIPRTADDAPPHAAADALAASIRAASIGPASIGSSSSSSSSSSASRGGRGGPRRAFLDGDVAESGDVVLDVVGVDPGVWYLGMHVHGATSSAFPGGDPRLAIPAESPSRAWAKIEQAIRAADARIVAGDRVVEVGASPGGVTHALLARGCEVVAIDPGEMDPRVLASPHLRHVRAPVAEVDPSSLARPVRFIVLDVNISPFAALRQIEGLVHAHADDLCAIFLTLKLGDWHMAARVPHLVSLVKKLGADVVEVHAKQLPANKVEICVVALTPAGVARRSSRA